MDENEEVKLIELTINKINIIKIKDEYTHLK